jgi:hypothetical protein
MHALRYCPVVELTDQAVDTTPTPVADETVVPFMNHMAVLPLVSRHSKSALPVLAPAQSRALHDKETHGVGLYHFRGSFGLIRGMEIRLWRDEGLDPVFALEPFLAPTRFR